MATLPCREYLDGLQSGYCKAVIVSVGVSLS